MNARRSLLTVCACVAIWSLPAAWAVAGAQGHGFIKLDDLMRGPSSLPEYPDYAPAASVLLNGAPIASCAAAHRLDDDPIGMITAPKEKLDDDPVGMVTAPKEKLDDDPVGMITVQLVVTKGYLETTSAGLNAKAKSGEPPGQAVLMIADADGRCTVTLGKLSGLTVTRRGYFEEVAVRFGEIRVSSE